VGCHAESLPQAGQQAIKTLELQTRLEIWNDLAQKPVAVQNIRKRLNACVFKAGGHFALG